MKVYKWGHPAGTHTTSYVMEEYARAFAHLGHEVVRVDGGSPMAVTPGSLIFTEGVVDQFVPVQKDCKYILHNCNREKYATVYENCVHLGVLAKFSGDMSGYETIRPWAFWDASTRTLFQPWATNLMPHEIDLAWADLARRRLIHYVGTVTSQGMNNNWEECKQMARAAAKRGVEFHAHGGYTGNGFHDGMHMYSKRPNDVHHRQLIQESYVAPTLLGKFQRDQEYIPCRAFKNISYGHGLLTNSLAVRDFFAPYMTVVYAERCSDLLDEFEVQKKLGVREQMAYVRDNHTFINRIETLLELL